MFFSSLRAINPTIFRATKQRLYSTSKINHCYNALKVRMSKNDKIENDYSNKTLGNSFESDVRNLNSLSIDDYYYVMSVMQANGICYDTYRQLIKN